MGWEKRRNRRYYYRSRRSGDRVTKEYIGTGPTAELIAAYNVMERDERFEERLKARADQEQFDAAEAPLAEFCEVSDAVARVVLLSAGYHQHARGAWRKRRGH